MLTKLSLSDLDISGKTVFMRVDFNVPMKNGKVHDDTRIVASLPSIKYVLENNAKLILASHMGRPKGEVIDSLSLKPVAEHLSSILGQTVKMAPDCIGEETSKLAGDLNPGEVLLLENLRFHKEETENDDQFSRDLASLAEKYVNDAFGTAHRAHASTEGITNFIEQCACGFLIEKEIEYFDRVLANPERPYIALLGGAKISTKIPVIENLIDKVDGLLIGGGMAFTFYKAKGLEIGKSLLEAEMVEKVSDILKKASDTGKDLLLPFDVVVAREFSNDADKTIVSATNIPASWMGLDIGPDTTEFWKKAISLSKTIVWNGPMGAFELDSFSRGTIEIAHAVANSNSISIVGGGDSVAALEVAGVKDKISHVSTGGGASLDFLAGKTLPGIAALTDK